MSEVRKIRRALISVYDKTGIVEFARALHEEFGIELISTGGTARTLKEAGLPVTLVEEVTGFPEMMDGRVKTLHPKIHAAILANRDNPEHMRQLKEQGIEPIDMVVVNLYPFEDTIAKPDCTFEQAIEMIDIGGPCLLRAAAKNHRHVLAVPDAEVLDLALRVLRQPEPSGFRRGLLAQRAYVNTCGYDAAIATWLGSGIAGDLPSVSVLRLREWEKTRYGENPHQEATVHQYWGAQPEPDIVRDLASGSEMSFNNYADASAALELCAELTRAKSMWHRFSTGDSSQRRPVDKPIADERLTRRNLPHIQQPGATYFVTFRIRTGTLSPRERGIVQAACTHWHGRKMTLHAATIMPDHVHLLLTPHPSAEGEAVSLGELLHSIKRHSAREVNKLRGQTGPLWLDESFDRLVRNEREFIEKWEYIEANPVTAGLVDEPSVWQWFWRSDTEFMEQVREGSFEDHRLQTGATTPIPAICFIKHTNACGVSTNTDPIEAYRKAYLGDPNAAMGGILAVNFPVTVEFATAVMETYQRWGKDAGAGGFFVEVWLAPQFSDDAVETIRTHKPWGKRVRLLAVGDMDAQPDPDEMDLKRIAGGVLMQTRDLVGLNEDQWKVVTERQPTESEMDDLRLAWLVCKHTKSNAITICKDGMLLGNGAGQMSRVMSCRIATWLPKENGHADKLKGSVAASDAFFPFRDGPDILADAGVSALIQPGGSKRDEDTIAACNERGLAMIFTGTRHFRH